MLIRHLQELLDTEDVDSAWDQHVRLMRDYGFDRLLYVITRNSSRRLHGDEADLLTLSTFPDGYLQEYLRRGYFRCAPMLRWISRNSGACSWSWIERQHRDGRLSQAEAEAYAFNRDMGLTAGYTVSFLGQSARAMGGISLVAASGTTQAQADGIWKRHGDEIILANRVFHLKFLQLPKESCRDTLTSRQREVLEWVAEGKTTQDIATIMGLNATTVEKHLRLARQALMVETTAQAVVKALDYNWIFNRRAVAPALDERGK